MRQLPEALFQLIREFEKEEGAFVGGRAAAAWFAPNDDALGTKAPLAIAGIWRIEGDGKLGADLEAPGGSHPHAPLGNLDFVFAALLFVDTVIE